MNLLFRLFVFLAISHSVIFAQEKLFSVAHEWVLTRAPSRASWKKILSGSRELELVETFGTHEKYALVRQKAKLTQKLPKEIIALQRNYPYRAVETPDPDLIQSWGLSNSGQTIPALGQGIAGTDVGALKTWQIEPGNKKVVVAVLDTGLDLFHEDLKNNLWINHLEQRSNSLDDDHNGFINDVHGWNFVNDNTNIQDDNNHGTAVSGVIAADAKNGKGTRGLAENISVMTVKILDSNGSGTTERAVRGIEYAVKNGATVINASWGGPLYDQVLFDTIKWANERGVLIVCAAGNEGKDNDIDDRPIYPASFKIPNIISVAAHDSRGELASFSNFGKQTVHVSAPGVAVYSTVRGGYQFMNGTSFAAPFVAAIGGLLKWREPSLKPEDISKRLISTAIPMHYYNQQKLTSGGRVHGFNALKNIGSIKPEPPKEWRRISKSVESFHPYNNNSQLEFEIKHPGATHIRVHFVKLELEKQYDYLQIKDEEGRIAMSYSGQYDAFWSADVLGQIMKIELLSDVSNAQWGFAIDAIEITEK